MTKDGVAHEGRGQLNLLRHPWPPYEVWEDDKMGGEPYAPRMASSLKGDCGTRTVSDKRSGSRCTTTLKLGTTIGNSKHFGWPMRAILKVLIAIFDGGF